MKYFFSCINWIDKNFYMTNIEKIANAKKRIDELERLIKYWNNSEYDEQKIVDFSMKIENNVA